MEVEAIYDQGRLEFLQPIQFVHSRFNVRIEIPEKELIQPVTQQLQVADIVGFPQEVQEEVARLKAVQHQIMDSLPEDEMGDSEEQRLRWSAIELRNNSRRDQGRTA